MRKIILLALVFFTSFTAFGQDFSNKGKDFWVAYGYHQVMTAGNGQNMVLYFAADVASVVTVSIPGLAYSQTYNVAANTIFTTPTLPKGGAQDARLNTNGLLDKGIHITSDFPIVAYAHIYNASVSGACVLLPTNTLGKEYSSINYTNNSNVGNSNCWFYVIATEPGTTDVEITPSADAIGHPAGVPFTVTLQQGQVYNVMGTVAGNNGTDLTGSKVKSVAAGNVCKRIAVFSGSGRIYINCGAGGNSSDNYMVQSFPKAAWGKKYLTVPTGGSMTRNIYRVCVSDPAAKVTINGVLTTLPLINGFYYEIPITDVPQLIESDLAITVAQYITTQNSCGNGSPGDPEVIYLSSVEQNIKDVLFNSNLLVNPVPPSLPHQHWVNVVIPNSGTALSSFTIDGAAPSVPFTVHPQDPNYSYIKIPNLTLGQHRMVSDSGFNAIAYGFATTESYGYNAGTNVRDLSQQLEIGTTYGIETSPSVCTNAPFVFKVYFPDSTLTNPPVAIRFDSIRWNISNPALIVPNNFPIMHSPPTIDSTNIRNGRQVNWYSLPTTYYFNAAGVDTLLITGYTSTNEGCGSTREYEFPIQITDPPTASFTAVTPGCYAEPVVVTETTPQLPKPTYRHWWEFYDPVTNLTTVYSGNGVRNASHTFTTPGVKRIRHSSITTPGCLSDTIVQMVTLADLPTATIAGSTAVCMNSTPDPLVTFTGSLGTAEYIFSYNINGGATIVTPPSTSGIFTVNAPTTVAGTFVYNLIGVANASPVGTPCTRTITGQSVTVTVNPLPAAAIAGGTTVCLNGAPPPVTFTGSGGTAPYTFAYSINGVPQTPVVSDAAGIFVINAPTNVAGTFNYTITLVTDASSTLCSSATNVSTIITVNDLPDAAISGATAVCLNAAQPPVTFTGSGGTAPYTFNYTINGVAQPPLVSNAAGIGTISAPTNVAGTFTYALVSVQEGSPIACLRAGLTGTTIITVNPLPAAAIAGGTTVCLNGAQPPVTFTGSGGTAPYTFNYTINGVPYAPVISDAFGVYVLNAPTNVAGTFNYTITQVTDASSTLCSTTTNVSTIIIVNDLPDAAISGTTSVCLNGTQPTVTFTGSGGTAPYTFNYTINSVAQPPIISNAAGIGTISAPTTVAGIFTYALVSVQEGSPIACLRTGLTGTTIITVNPLPTGVISGATQVCRNDASPFVTFTGSGATAPYTFSYTINGTPQTPVVSNAAGVATVAVPTTVAGTFIYVLTSVQDASSTLCTQVIVGQQTIVTVHQLPTPDFSYTAPSCETRTISFTDLSVANSGNINRWLWDFDDPSSAPNNTSNLQNPTHVFSTAGTYNVTLRDTTDLGCTNEFVFTRAVVINNRPKAGFIIPEVCLSDTYAQFIDTSTLANAAIDRWDWNFGDPGSGPLNVSSLQNPTHSYSAVGNYSVTLIVWNFALGCRDTITQILTVNGSFPVAIFNVQNPTTLCANDSVAVIEQSTVFPGVITKVEIWFDNLASGPPGPPDILDNTPFTGKVYRHLYPNFQSPLTKTFQIRYRAYSGGVCLDDSIRNITVNAAPLVQFNNMPDTCLLASPFQITQASEIGGVPGSGVFSGPGVSPSGIFTPMTAGIGTHTIMYTFTSTVGGCVDTMSNTITVLDTAHAAFTFVAPSCEQTPTSFTDISTWPPTVTPFNTVWDFGDGSPIENHAPGTTFGHIFPAPGTYTVTMYNVSQYGCNSTVTSQQVTIDPNHTITLTSGSDNQTVCINNPIVDIVYTLAGGANNATVTGLPSGVTYTVAGNILTISGTPNSNTGGPTFTYTVLTTGNTCLIADTTGIITVDPDHTIAFTSGDTTQSVCVNSPIDPIVYTLGGGANNVAITNLPPGIVYTVVGNTLTISGTPTTIAGGPLFAYTIQTTGNTCVIANAAGEIKVNPYPVPNFAPDKPSYCIPNAIVIFNNSSTMPDGSGMTYAWNFGEPSSPSNTSTAFSPSHWYSGTGPFDVRLVVTSTAVLNGNVIGCAHDTTIRITTIHPQPKADFVFNKPSVCIGDNVIITDNTDGKDGIVNQWSWDLGDGTTRVTNPVTHTYGDTITYNITMFSVNSHGCNSDTITKPFIVYPYPHVNAGPDKFVLEGGSVLLEAVTFANDAQYVWTPNLYLNDNRIARPRVMDPKTDMTYRLTVTGRGGCALSDDVFVKLLKFPVIPNTFTPNNDGINDTWRIDYLHTYPNNRVQIFTRAGNLVFESRGYTTPWDGTMKGKPMPFDTYYYIIEPGNGRDPITGYVTIIK